MKVLHISLVRLDNLHFLGVLGSTKNALQMLNMGLVADADWMLSTWEEVEARGVELKLSTTD